MSPRPYGRKTTYFGVAERVLVYHPQPKDGAPTRERLQTAAEQSSQGGTLHARIQGALRRLVPKAGTAARSVATSQPHVGQRV